METQEISRAETPEKITLSCKAPDAKTVLVGGTFNDWQAARTPLKKKAKGMWSAQLELPRGEYEYKFFIDGMWCCEPGCADTADVECPKCVPNSFGTMNRMLRVE